MGDDRHLRRRLAATGVAIALFGVAPASAHAVLVDSRPAEGERVVEPPDAVILEFSEPVDVIEVTVTTPGGADVADGSPEQVDEAVRQPLEALPEQGTYTTRYRVLSLDDHTITGEVTFDYAGPVADLDRQSPEDRREPADPDGDEPARERPLPLRLWPLLVLAVALAAVAAVAVRAFRRTRAPGGDR